MGGGGGSSSGNFDFGCDTIKNLLDLSMKLFNILMIFPTGGWLKFAVSFL